ncbi:MAG: UDP-galactopyranose mutase [Candidatus Abyssubacteria bacterium]
MKHDYLVVGAGLAGCVVAEQLATRGQRTVLIVEKRDHIGGNCYDYYDRSGILVHKYGPHIFHTNMRRVWEYLSQFTTWRHYHHRVLAYVDGMLVPIPISLDTINTLYGLNLSVAQLEEFLDARRQNTPGNNSAELVIGQVGEELYKKFFRGYSRKQWGMDPEMLDPSVCGRVSVRMNRDSRYFTDTYQGIPKHGYTEMIHRMVAHPNIRILLKTDYKEIIDSVSSDCVVYTGPIDYFFEYRHGKLPYRSLRFEFETLDKEFLQPVAQVNYPNDYDFTRITEFKHLTGQSHTKTTVAYEYPTADGDPYYPIIAPDNLAAYEKYREEAERLESVVFVGRLAEYRYYNMDVVVARALETADKLLAR